MKTRIGIRRLAAVLLAAPLLAVVAAAGPGQASPDGDGGHRDDRDHWGIITRNTIGSPVADLRNGPFGSFGVFGPESRPPYGQGSLGIEVADGATALTPPAEKVDFGNEVDFFGRPVSGLTQVGFHVFQTGENITYGGSRNMPNIRFEIDPNLAALPTTEYSTLVWAPAAAPVTNRWSGYLDAATSGTWFLTGAAGTATNCNLTVQCTFAEVKARLDADGGEPATVYTAAVGKGRDFMWIGAVDGLRINNTVYDFEVSGVRQRPAA
ncbi:hypothetical protein QEZ54_09555 [Catellatospora sp. KI3]|uniref:hypothetical protein n=1 Tax=Catellatospora sp. KI3 TaxID=3041620 RepID=UPI0024827DE9|nr:hypothetical protein [Catellatospora sp. KI3]MDI1461211.1 hypothetical protein [Catellatospora sp. KI3]